VTNRNADTILFAVNPTDEEAIRHLREAVIRGEHWYIALLEAIELWVSAKEERYERSINYLIANEAFDWLLLAERLIEEIYEMLPEDEIVDLLFHNKPPIEIAASKFRELIGGAKYRQYLNYFYGITVEEMLILVVKEEIRKEKRASGISKEQDSTDEAYSRIYGENREVLLKNFRKEKEYPQRKSVGIQELKEFTYWLFKYRLKHSERAKVASDTRKALNYLNSIANKKNIQLTVLV